MPEEEEQSGHQKWKPDHAEGEERQQPRIFDVDTGAGEANLGFEQAYSVPWRPEQQIMHVQQAKHTPLNDADVGAIVEVKVRRDPQTNIRHRRKQHEQSRQEKPSTPADAKPMAVKVASVSWTRKDLCSRSTMG